MAQMKIIDIAHFIELLLKGETEFFIVLGGMIRSSKHINYDTDKKLFLIDNEVDDTYQELTEAQLHTDSNIGLAIDNGCFYLY